MVLVASINHSAGTTGHPHLHPWGVCTLMCIPCSVCHSYSLFSRLNISLNYRYIRLSENCVGLGLIVGIGVVSILYLKKCPHFNEQDLENFLICLTYVALNFEDGTLL